jgi:hypothetical protein
MPFFKTLFKGYVQPFEPKGVTRLIRSAVKNWRSGNFVKKFFDDTFSREEHKTIYSGLRISKMTLSNQSHFPRFFVSPESHLIGLQYPFYCCLNLLVVFFLSFIPLPWGAEPRFELGPAVQYGTSGQLTTT